MRVVKVCLIFLVLLILGACGGGGGNASGSGGSTSDGGSQPASAPQITVSVVNDADLPVAGNSIGNGGSYFAVAKVVDAKGSAVEGALVTFSVSDAATVTLLDSSVLTKPTGLAKVKIQPAGLAARGAAVLTVSSKVGLVTITGTVNLQATPSNVTLGSISASPAALKAFQNAAVAVQSLVDGSAAGAGTVSATFTAPCGVFSPSTAYSDGAGVITTTFQPSGGIACLTGEVKLTATANGSSVSKVTTVTIVGATASTVNFSGATTPLLVARSVGGSFSRSRLTFKVLDNAGTPMRSQQLTAALSASSINAGIQFDGGTTAPQIITTVEGGLATVGVISGNIFVPVLVTATLVDDESVSATSYGVSVTSGAATQMTMSLASQVASMESWGFDGVKNILTMSVSDRLGNPLPLGTVVNFVTNHGIIGSTSGGTCTLAADSTCSVAYSSLNSSSRPANGRVAILAYLNGEESFVDYNGDSVWQVGEPFETIGWPYIDANENGRYDTGEQKIGLAPAATGPCSSGYPSVANTCNTAVWDGNVIVRKQIIVVQATQFAVIEPTTPRHADRFNVWISDSNGNSKVVQDLRYKNALGVYVPYSRSVGRNSMPTKSKVSAEVVVLNPDAPPKCKVLNMSSDAIGFTTDAAEFVVYLNEAADCLTVPIKVTVSTPGNSIAGEASVTSFTFTSSSFILP
ncbi:MAG: hypothetical protein QE283_04865 [Rhodoferax sp.]|nr:hypothetical protein [Rhodoferax sp.]